MSTTAVTAAPQAATTARPACRVTLPGVLRSEWSKFWNLRSSLADNLGKWLAVAVLFAAFALASLLTMSAVARRVREFGTLKALGWKSSRVVSQVMGESLAIGIAGGAVGVALGFGGAALVKAFAPALTATVGQATGSATRAAPGSSAAGAAGLAGAGSTAASRTRPAPPAPSRCTCQPRSPSARSSSRSPWPSSAG